MGVTLQKTRLDRIRQELRPAVAGGVTTSVDRGVELARQFVAVDSGHLQSRIEAVGDGLQQGYQDDAPYAFAQEFGFTPEQLTEQGKDGYTFTPYMRPSAEVLRQEHPANVAEAIREVTR